MYDLKDPETGESQVVDATSIRADYLDALREMRDGYRRECMACGADYVPLDTSMRFDSALVEYLGRRQARF
ncbi:MAG: hypothetical protein R3B90_18245 [Planctomycetaceae bacterium]